MKGAAECHWQAEQDGAARARYGAGHAAGHAAQRATALADRARACCTRRGVQQAGRAAVARGGARSRAPDRQTARLVYVAVAGQHRTESD